MKVADSITGKVFSISFSWRFIVSYPGDRYQYPLIKETIFVNRDLFLSYSAGGELKFLI